MGLEQALGLCGQFAIGTLPVELLYPHLPEPRPERL
jgi:hypothetical protein